MRVLKGRPLNLRHTFLDDEDVLTLTGVTVTLSDWEGSTVATENATDDGSGNWSATFPAQPMGVYTASWSDGTYTDETSVEVVGGYLFSVPQARNSDDYLTDATAFPAQEIVEYREVVESEFEKITGRSFTPRIATRTFEGDGSRELVSLIPDAQSIVSVSVNGEAVADLSGYLLSPLGKVTTPDATVDGDLITVRVLYGFATPPPEVARVGMVRLRNLLASESSGIPDRATTWQPEDGGTFRLATAGQGRWRTGIPEVDSTLKNYTLDVIWSVYGVG